METLPFYDRVTPAALATIAGSSAIMDSFKYRQSLQIHPDEMKRYLKKSFNLGLCYAGFAREPSFSQARGAGKAAFLSCAYDVATDWGKPESTQTCFEQILHAEVSPDLAVMAMNLLERDKQGVLQYDGLERGIVATHFVLEMMGLKETYAREIDIDQLGILLQIVDDIMDYEDGVRTGDQNCLTSENRREYLERIVTELDKKK